MPENDFGIGDLTPEEKQEMINELKKLPGNRPKQAPVPTVPTETTHPSESPKESLLRRFRGDAQEFKKAYLDLVKRETDLELATQKFEAAKKQIKDENSQLKRRCQELQDALDSKAEELSSLQGKLDDKVARAKYRKIWQEWDLKIKTWDQAVGVYNKIEAIQKRLTERASCSVCGKVLQDDVFYGQDLSLKEQHAKTHRTRHHLFFSRIPVIDWTEKKPTLQEFRQAVKEADIDWIPRSLKSKYPMPEKPVEEPTVPRPSDEDENENEPSGEPSGEPSEEE